MKRFTFLLCILTAAFLLAAPINSASGQLSGQTNNSTGDIKQDSLALVALYNSTEGEDWSNNTNWLSTNPVSSWHGITVSDNRVKEIFLRSNRLTGTIPPDIGGLSALTNLDLYYNNLSGLIPPEIGNLTKLSNLGLIGNKLKGMIPSEIGNLINLKTLFLSNNRITGIPFEIGDLDSLNVLDISVNSLTGEIPQTIFNITNLSYLDLSRNGLSGPIPSDIKGMTKLERLYLSKNNFTSLSPEIGDLKEMTSMNLSENDLSGIIPLEIGELTKILSLDLSENNLTGSIPKEIGKLTELKGLSIDENQITGSIPNEIGNLIKLISLDLNNNNLTGSIPSEIGDLRDLKYLNLSINQLTGSIPAEIGSLSSLKGLSLIHNNLNGSIPPELGDLKKLTSLSLSNNDLSGSIPPELGNMVSLGDLTINNNRLSGSIPKEIGRLSNLSYLDLGFNTLFGTIPSELGDLHDLYYLHLHNNNLQGAIPNSLSNLKKISSILFYNNRFTSIPKIDYHDRIWRYIVENNFLTFEDIEPNLGIRGYDYSPQLKSGREKRMRLSIGDTLNIDGKIGGSANLYQWYKDNKIIEGAEFSEYEIIIESSEDFGTYYVKTTNYNVPDLTIQSRDIVIKEKLNFENVYRAGSDTVVSIIINSNSSVLNTVEFNSSSSVSVMFLNRIELGQHISISQLSGLEDYPNIPVSDNIIEFYNIESPISSFYAEITFGYTDEMLEGINISENELAANYFNVKTLTWVTVPGEVDTVNNTITVNKNHFSIWSIGEAQVGFEPVEYPSEILPEEFQLGQNYPNPFNPVTRINYHLPEAAHVTLTVYNILGQEVARIVDTGMPAGYHSVKWDASGLASGTYIYRITACGFTDVKKMVLIK